MRVYLLTLEQLGEAYEGVTQADAIKAALETKRITAGTVLVIPESRIRKIGVESAPATLSLVSDEPLGG